jgi:hypothetical protein
MTVTAFEIALAILVAILVALGGEPRLDRCAGGCTAGCPVSWAVCVERGRW